MQHNPRVAIVVDDLASIDHWRPRLIEVRGEAEILSTGGDTVGPGFDPEMFRIKPRRIISLGIAGEGSFLMNARWVKGVGRRPRAAAFSEVLARSRYSGA